MAQPSPLRRPEWLVQFGWRLLLARGKAGLTQLALAQPDLSKSFISLLESGRTFPSVESVLALAQRTNSSVAALLMDPAELRLETALNLLHLASQMDLAARGAEAVKLVASAEALLPDMPMDMRIRAALLRGRTAIAAHQLDDAARWVDAAVSIARRQRRPNRLGMALALKGEIAIHRRAYLEAVQSLEEATSIMQRAREARTEESVRAFISLGTARWQVGRLTGARRAYKRAEHLAARLRLHTLRGKALSGLGLAEWTRRRLESAASSFVQARDVLFRAEDIAEVSRVLNNLGGVRREQGRYEDALAVLEQAARIHERLKNTRDMSATLDETARVLLDMGRHAEASRAARRAIAEAQTGRDHHYEAAAQMTLGRVLRAQGRMREATTLYRGALATFKRLGMKGRAAAAADELRLVATESGAEAPRQRLLEAAEQLPG